MDLIIRQAAEIGVSAILPVFSRNSIVQYERDSDIEPKRLRWQKIIKEALQQSGSQILTTVGKPEKISHLAIEENALVLFFHQDETDSIPLHNILANNYKLIYILVGPEGGFTNDEVLSFKERHFIPVFLGSNVLRVETAAVAALSSVKLLLMENEFWRTK
jgi:16S rRNA (uracil1498-N3)-methyltransferase